MLIRPEPIRNAVENDGALELATEFGRVLGNTGCKQLLPLAYGIMALHQEVGEPEHSYVHKDYELLDAARKLIEAYTVDPDERHQNGTDD